MMFISRVIAIMFVLGCLGVGIPNAEAQSTARSWTEEKCVRYKGAWSDYVSRTGGRGLSQEFTAAHQAFIDSGCLQGRNVCPRSAEELNAANTMTIRAMNAGTSSTFLPFACAR